MDQFDGELPITSDPAHSHHHIVFSSSQSDTLLDAYLKHGRDWVRLAQIVGHRVTGEQCRNRIKHLAARQFNGIRDLEKTLCDNARKRGGPRGPIPVVKRQRGSHRSGHREPREQSSNDSCSDGRDDDSDGGGSESGDLPQQRSGNISYWTSELVSLPPISPPCLFY